MSDEAPRMFVITEEQLRQLLASQTVEEWVQQFVEGGDQTPMDAQRPRLREQIILEKFDKTDTTADESTLVPFERLVVSDRVVDVPFQPRGEGEPCQSH